MHYILEQSPLLNYVHARRRVTHLQNIDSRKMGGGSHPDIDVHPNSRLGNMPLTTISKLSPFSGLIITMCLVILFIVKYYILEMWLLTRVYGSTYTDLNDSNRRGFLNHHIAGGTKILILVVAVYPFIDVAFGNATLHSPFAGSQVVTMGDVLVVAAQLLLAMYIFELIYRVKISPISIVHHIGSVMVGQAAIAISLNLVREKDADIEFILVTVWGTFFSQIQVATVTHPFTF